MPAKTRLIGGTPQALLLSFVESATTSLGHRRIGRRRPVGTKQKFLDAIGVQEIVKRQVPEHDEDRIGPILAVLGGLRPFRRAERLEPSNQTLAVEDETVKARVEIHP